MKHSSLLVAVMMTASDVLIIVWLQAREMRYLQLAVIVLIALVVLCFIAILGISHPNPHEIMNGFIPRPATTSNSKMLFLAIGIVGATIMPHNLYLHSSLVKKRHKRSSFASLKTAIRFASIDVSVALLIAFLINCAILITCASVFHASGHTQLVSLEDAHHLISPLLGTQLAGLLFGAALLAAGQSAAVTSTLAGQVVMEGFTDFKMAPWKRRLIGRLIAIVPAILVIAVLGSQAMGKMLIWNQEALSLQLPFAVFPLLYFTGSKSLMGPFATGTLLKTIGGVLAVAITLLNVWHGLKMFAL